MYILMVSATSFNRLSEQPCYDIQKRLLFSRFAPSSLRLEERNTQGG